MKYIVIVLVALSIDAFQALVALGLAAAFAVFSGTIGGAAAGCVVGSTVGLCKVLGAVGGVAGSFFNPVAAPYGMQVGAVIGAVLDFCISAVFGTGFIALLVFTRLLKLGDLLSLRFTPPILVKLLPFIDILPFYTFLAVSCILKKNQEEGGIAGKALALAASGGMNITAIGDTVRQISPEIAGSMGNTGRGSTPTPAGEPAKQKSSASPPLVDGIRAGSSPKESYPEGLSPSYA
ncbi:MAG: hypothetical protein KGJ34_01015 [Patescibacteria group bacterium]|nr:hypothetical protein [Patescibacteria group bacterium]